MIHLMIRGNAPKSFCGQRAFVSLTFDFIFRHIEWAAVMMRFLGCRECIYELDDAIATARPIR
jgi:hypothetical protein